MKILIDENLPLEILNLLPKDVAAFHVNQLKSCQKQRITDDQLRRYALKHDCILCTKDDDFVRSWVSRKVPEKLIFIHFEGRKDALLTALKLQIDIVLPLIREYDFMEFTRMGIRIPFENTLPYS